MVRERLKMVFSNSVYNMAHVLGIGAILLSLLQQCDSEFVSAFFSQTHRCRPQSGFTHMLLNQTQ